MNNLLGNLLKVDSMPISKRIVNDKTLLLWHKAVSLTFADVETSQRNQHSLKNNNETASNQHEF